MRSGSLSPGAGLYYYDFSRDSKGTVTWTRQTISYGGKAGAGLQLAVTDIDKDGDMDVISAGKSGLFLSENVTPRSLRR